MPKPATHSDSLATAERRAFVLGLRRSGTRYRDIAAQAEAHFGRDKLPAGWDERYAYKDVKRELDRVNAEMAEDASVVIGIELTRLDGLYEVMWDKAMAGDEKAVDRCVRIAERRAKLLGLDAPTRTEVSGKGGGAIHHEYKAEVQLHGGVDHVAGVLAILAESGAIQLPRHGEGDDAQAD